MSSSNTAFLFVPGAWCPGYYYHKVTKKLQDLGHSATYTDLPSVGRKDIVPGLDDDAAHVRIQANALLDAGKDVVIVGNSYGGFVVLEACKGLTHRDGLKHIITINSPLALKGQTMQDLVGDQAPVPKDDTKSWIEAGPVELGLMVFFGSLPEEEGRKYAAMVKEQSVKPLREPLSFAAYEEVPCTAVISGKDLAFKTQSQHEVRVPESSFRCI
jgi:pimeloyl-ACP methyl ester carboxylesterase